MRQPAYMMALALGAMLSFSTGVRSQPAYFCVNGGLVAFDGAQSRSIAPRHKNGEPAHVHRFWGTFHNRPVVTLEMPESKHKGDPLAAGAATEAHPLVVLDELGRVESVIANDVARAFPSPDGLALAYVTSDRRCFVKRGESVTTLTVNGRVSHVAWSSDCTKLAVVIYPEDWSPTAVNNARTTDEFFRLQTSKILLFDAISLAPLATVVENDGTNYNPFFSPDSDELYYIHLDLLDDSGGVRKLMIGDAGTTTGQLMISTGDQSGGIPLGRVGTYLWHGSRLVFEAGTPEGGGVVWMLAPDGKGARSVAPGRYPQKLADGRIAYLRPDSQPAVLELSPTEDKQQ
ncbi:MAG: hypothetical protein N2Z21_02860 [Candidatus Sumerlaeaceae bacterium]|nr:hypothetical protein [Candidatus Sumerlaeaceae bacterium]